MNAEITVVEKSGGILSKSISLRADGTINADGSACVMSRGSAHRAKVADVHAFAALIEGLKPYQAITLGALRDDLPDRVRIITKDKLNGVTQPNVIARSSDHIVYRPRRQAFALIDFDTKGMPRSVAARIKKAGGLWQALLSVMPELADVARVVRRSTSAGLFNHDTGKKIKGSGGVHIYLAVAAGTDIERFLKVLHDRCWLAGFGWMMIGTGGQILERSIVDPSVGAPERLVFEGAPIVRKPLGQDQDSRKPIAHDGKVLRTRSACPKLTPGDQADVDVLKAKATQRLEPEAAKVRSLYVQAAVRDMVQRTGKSEAECERILNNQYERQLLSGNIVLQFADKALKGCTVADVLDDPKRFEGKRLADPNEGVSYGRSTAIVMLRRDNGEPWIKSFAHGGISYSLRSEDGLDYEQILWENIRKNLRLIRR